MDKRNSDVVIIGGGISGLSCAKLLQENGLKVILLEARSRIGGRTYTKRDPTTYKYVDLGGSYVGPTQNRILRLAKQYGISTYKINDEGDYVFYSKGTCLRFQSSWPQYWNPFVWLDINNLFREIDHLLEEIPLDEPWNAPRAEEWDNTTMQEFCNKICWTQPAKEFCRSFVNTNVTMELSEVSMLWFLWYVKSCGGSKRIWEVDNGGQERKFIGGSMQISEGMARDLGENVIFNSQVMKITNVDNKVIIDTINGKKYKGQYAVLALAPTMLTKITFDPPLSPHRLQLIQRVPMGSCVKNQTWYDKPFWKEKGMNGFGTAADGIEPVGNTVDDCRPGDPLFSIVGFVTADQARKFSVMSKEERKQATCECYARIFNSSEAMNPVYYEDFDWSAEEFSGGCYTSTYPPGVMTRFGKEIRQPIGQLYFAGTETAQQWTGYMEGAVEAGERAAREILHNLEKINHEDIWKEEPESKEFPSRPFVTTFMEKYAPSVGQTLIILTTTSIILGSCYIAKKPKGFFEEIGENAIVFVRKYISMI